MAIIAIIVGHPRSGSFCAALGDAYAAGARAAGHQVTLTRLSEIRFDPCARQGFENPPLEPDLRATQEAIGAADHTVWVWPLWLGYPPAILKGFLERVLTFGFAADRIDGPPFYRPLLTGKSARVIVTMQMPALVFRFFAGARAAKTFSKQILAWTGMKPVRRTYFGMVEHVGDAKRKSWLDEVNQMGRRAQ